MSIKNQTKFAIHINHINCQFDKSKLIDFTDKKLEKIASQDSFYLTLQQQYRNGDIAIFWRSGIPNQVHLRLV